MKDVKVKQVLSRWRAPVGGERVNGDCEGGQIRSMHFVYMYKNLAMKLVEIILRRRERG
jgi:hypothetical protein